MKVMSINQGATATLMWNAQAQAKPHADCNARRFVVQTHSIVIVVVVVVVSLSLLLSLLCVGKRCVVLAAV